MTIDLSEFLAKPVVKCAITRAIETIEDKNDLEKIAAALASPVVSNYSIVRWLKARGIQTTDSTVATHRKRRCRCESIAPEIK